MRLPMKLQRRLSFFSQRRFAGIGRFCCAFPLLLLVFVLQLCAPALHAAIFMRLGPGATALEQLGGKTLHSADVRINGQPGHLSAFGFDASPERLTPDLRNALQMPELTAHGATLVTHVANDHATSLLLLPGADDSHSVAILIEQSADARQKSQQTPPAWPGEIRCPNADLQFSAENEKTRTSLAVATTMDSPAAIRSRMATTLAAASWTQASPGTGGSLDLYARNNQVCIVFAAADNSSGQTRITILQRLGSTR